MSKLISDQEFATFREFFYRKTGIKFEDTKRYFVDKRLLERVRETGNDTFREYFTTLRFQASGEELQHLTNLLTVNETYFMREDYQFDCLVKSILPEICKTHDRSKPIRIWCIPSSSGEEPYSIAMWLLERWPGINQWDVELIASDIDTGILNTARQGLYSERSIRLIPPSWKTRYFSRVGLQYQLCDDLRSAVEFTHVNLSNVADVRRYRPIDVIFCRNLLIYFDDVSRKAAAEAMFDVMAPGAFICLGHSESMGRISPLFKVRKFPGAIVYQKPLEES
ncbi:CheR family methyltransferase [Oceanobacter kriegii]|uniref:CheR family methyltransferase n=1 Tax=Oceanobacter kriegii TaxID=64972 RepID=UPI0004198915|nr:protein-glutamate O-methyltransferase CheR [Oceanobacter kriegii]